MSIKVCPKCQVKNAVGNRNCVKCGRSLIHDRITSDQKKGNFYLYMMERLFSSVLAGCAVISVFFALMAILNQPAFTIFSFID
ncbi:MAG: hypothetical protein CVV27_04250 [Candidatus Melainabacteria bacterium HGW-Melainabacteria-1]|nr:MAG: hypothetical protein CVV27_04250 [Candidatus Melainabacteria bacterium HGW-Melainabacteria-1]